MQNARLPVLFDLQLLLIGLTIYVVTVSFCRLRTREACTVTCSVIVRHFRKPTTRSSLAPFTGDPLKYRPDDARWSFSGRTLDRKQ